MQDLPQTRHSLLLRLRAGSDGAWMEFLTVYEQAIYSYCRGRGLQDADARDVTQDVLAAVEQRVGSWDGDPARGSFRGWLLRVARNIAVDCFHRWSRRESAGGGTAVARLMEAVPQSEEAQQDAFWLEYRRHVLDWAVAQVKPQVSERAWTSFWSTAVLGRGPDDVARELGTSVGAVYTAKCRVFRRVRECIAQLDDEAQLEGGPTEAEDLFGRMS